MAQGNKIGSHVVEGSRNGFGDIIGQAVVTAVNEGGALVEAKGNYINTVTVYRVTEPPPFYLEAPQDFDNWTIEQAQAHADYIYPSFKSKWLLNPADYYIVLNEPFNEQPNIDVYLAYERRLIDLAFVDGFRICMLNLAGGSPTFDTWNTLVVPHIRYGASKGAVYGRHAYGGQLWPLDGNTGRPFQEAEYLMRQRINAGIIITELGYEGGYTYKPDIIENQLPLYDEVMKNHSNIIGGCLWTIGSSFESASAANWEDSSPWMASYCAANPATKWTPPDVDPPPIEPPPAGEKELIYEQYFDQGWTDRTGSQQIPNYMEFKENLGFNPYATDGTGNTHNQFLPCETRILWDAYLPPAEHDKYLNERGFTLKVFKKDAPFFCEFVDTIPDDELSTKKYEIVLDLVGDTFEWDNGKKPPNDPKHLRAFINIGDMSKEFILSPLEENIINFEFKSDQFISDYPDTEIGFEILATWGADNNGVFVRSFKMYRIPDDTEPPTQPPTTPPDIVDILELLGHAENDIKTGISSLNHAMDDIYKAMELVLSLDCGETGPEPIPPPNGGDFYGIDLSRHNVLSQAKWDTLVNVNKVRFVIIRLMFGATPDEAFATHYENANSRGLIIFVYGFPVDTIDPILQADSFITELRKWTVSGIIANDVEKWGQTLISFSNYKKYVDRIREVRPRQMTYTRANIYNGISETDNLELDLWVADYMYQNRPVSLPLPRQPALPKAWKEWKLCQVSSTDFDGEGSLDVDVFNGDWNAFNEWLNADPTTPPPSNGETIDLLPYFNPPATVQYMVRHPDGSQERFRTEYGDGGWYYVKNNLWEHWLLRDGKICLASDISPAPQPSNDTPRYYIVRENGVYGASWCKRYMKIGETYHAAHGVQFYAKDNCRELDENSGASANTNTLIAHYASMTFSTGITLQDVIEIGNPAGEIHLFAKGYGRVGWSSAWGRSEISEIVEGQTPMERETIPCMLGTL